MTITVAGTYTSPDESPLSGWVALSLANPRAVHSTAPEFVASKRVVSELDETGSVSFEVTASDDPGWELGPVLYRVEEHLSQQEHLTWFGYLTEPVEGDGVRLEEVDRIADPELGYWPPAHIPVPGPPNVLTVDSTTTGDPGTDADVTISGTSPEQALAFTIPRGDQGDVGPQGDPGPQGDAATVDAGTTTTGDAGTDAAVVNSGSTSAAVFDFTIPKGDKGDKGDAGALSDADPFPVGDTNEPGTDLLGSRADHSHAGTRITRPNVDDRLVEQWNGSAWSAVDYDSGWRDVTADLLGGITATHHLQINRVNQRVTVRLGGVTGDGVTKDYLTLPSGWRAAASSYYTFVTGYMSNSQEAQLSSQGGSVLTVSRSGIAVPAGVSLWSEFSYSLRSGDPIPTSLPGVLVSAAPQ